LVDETNSIPLGKILEGDSIVSYSGDYAAGAALFRVRNTNSKEIKCIRACNVTAENLTLEFPSPIYIETFDIIDAFCVAVPT